MLSSDALFSRINCCRKTASSRDISSINSPNFVFSLVNRSKSALISTFNCSLTDLNLRRFWQLKSKEKRGGGDANRSDKNATPAHDRECQLMGVTWLLSKNRTLFLPATTSVLRVLMAADGAGVSDPTSCSLSLDDMPLAVGSDQIGGHGGCSTVGSLPLFQLSLLTLVLFALYHV